MPSSPASLAPSEWLLSILGDQTFLLGPLGDSWGLSLSVAVCAKKPFTTSALSATSVTRVAAPLSNGLTISLVFLLLLMSLKKLLLLFLTSWAKFNPSCILSFLISFLHNLTASQHSFRVASVCLLPVLGFWQKFTVHPHRWTLTPFASFCAWDE